MNNTAQEEEFIEILRSKVSSISNDENNIYPGYGYVTIGEAVRAYKEAIIDFREQQAKAKQPHRPRLGTIDDELSANHY